MQKCGGNHFQYRPMETFQGRFGNYVINGAFICLKIVTFIAQELMNAKFKIFLCRWLQKGNMRVTGNYRGRENNLLDN
jgi:hypothetical protein